MNRFCSTLFCTFYAAATIAYVAVSTIFIKKALTEAGVTVNSVKPPRYCQDGVFVANEALLGIDEETMLMARLPKGREAETPYYTSVLRTKGKRVLRLPNEAWYFSGQGDALRYGSHQPWFGSP